MIDRERIIGLVAYDDHGWPVATGPSAEELAELCRVYLAWLDAPEIEMTDCNNPKRQLPNDPFEVSWEDFPKKMVKILEVK